MDEAKAMKRIVPLIVEYVIVIMLANYWSCNETVCILVFTFVENWILVLLCIYFCYKFPEHFVTVRVQHRILI